MPASFDLNLLPLCRRNGQDQPELPGLYAVSPPRRAARGRDEDSLVLYLSVGGTAPLPADQYNPLLVRLVQRYYKSPGTVTAAMRLAAEELNQFLLERNLRSSSSGRQGIGLLTLLALRGENLYLAHSGPVHAFVLTPQETLHLHDPQGAGRGLGLSRTLTIRYYQAGMHPNEFLLLTHQPSPAWDPATLRVSANQGLESLRRRLLSGRTDPELDAVLIQTQAGTGKIRLLRLKTAFQDMAHPSPGARAAVAPPEPAPVAPTGTPAVETTPVQPQAGLAQVPVEETAAPAPEEIPVEKLLPLPETQGAVLETTTPTPPAAQPLAAPVASAAKPPKIETASVPVATSPEVRPVRPAAVPAPRPRARPAPAKPARPRGEPIKRVVRVVLAAAATFLKAVAGSLQQVGRGALALFRRVLPDESVLNISPSTLLFLALAVPIVIGVVGGAVYIERGQAAQHQAYYQQALREASRAAAMTDPAEMRVAWQATLDYLDKAEFYRVTPESQALLLQARTELDRLNGVERLDYQPALLDSLDKTAKITRIVATGGELYLLNHTDGSVIRAVLTGSGYQVDASFVCGSVPGPTVVGPLVDIAPLPRGFDQGATLLGTDVNGALLLCIPGSQPLISQMAPPGINFGGIRAIDLNAGDLYVLDPPTNAVWIYRGLQTGQPPRLFFGDQIPNMSDVIDLVVNGDDLYLLHADGHQTLCTYSRFQIASTRCEDPLSYSDPRPGRAGGPVIADALFDQISFVPPPDPSLYVLDPQNQAIYHFSLRLALQRQYRAISPLPQGKATAFAISPNRLAFLAIDQQVFYAALP